MLNIDKEVLISRIRTMAALVKSGDRVIDCLEDPYSYKATLKAGFLPPMPKPAYLHDHREGQEVLQEYRAVLNKAEESPIPDGQDPSSRLLNVIRQLAGRASSAESADESGK